MEKIEIKSQHYADLKVFQYLGKSVKDVSECDCIFTRKDIVEAYKNGYIEGFKESLDAKLASLNDDLSKILMNKKIDKDFTEVIRKWNQVMDKIMTGGKNG